MQGAVYFHRGKSTFMQKYMHTKKEVARMDKAQAQKDGKSLLQVRFQMINGITGDIWMTTMEFQVIIKRIYRRLSVINQAVLNKAGRIEV